MEWISVKNRMPLRRQQVLVTDGDGYCIDVLWYFGKDEEGEDMWGNSERVWTNEIAYWLVIPPLTKR